MKQHIIADTNVWYDIANCNLDPTVLKKQGYLCVAPISLLEIVSKIDPDTFELRQKAGKAILDYADKYIQSNESFLVRYWGVKYDNANDKFDWKQGVKNLVKAPSFDAMVNGYIDHQDNVKRKINLSFLCQWRDDQYNNFQQLVEIGINDMVPRYIERIKQLRTKTLRIPRLTDPEKIKSLDSNNFRLGLLLAMYERMKLCIPQNMAYELPEIPTVEMIESVGSKLDVYIDAYVEYTKALATKRMKPEGNDLGDHELFMYLQDKNWLLATSDKRWLNFAKEVCPRQVVDF